MRKLCAERQKGKQMKKIAQKGILEEMIEKCDDAIAFVSKQEGCSTGEWFDVFDASEFCLIQDMLRDKLAEAYPSIDNCQTCTKPYNEFEETVPLMLSDDYKARFVAEYRQTKIRYERLKRFCNRIEAALRTNQRDEIEDPKHDCPMDLLREQQRAMDEYLHTLEIRAVIERIEL